MKFVKQGTRKRFVVGNFKDAAGNPTGVDPNTPLLGVTSSNQGVIEIVDVSGLSFWARHIAPGECEVAAQVDKDISSGVAILPIVEAFTALTGEAAIGEFTDTGEEAPA